MKKLALAVIGLLLLASLALAVGQCGGGLSPATTRGELKLYGIDPITLDPAVSAEATSHQYIMQIFSGLVRLDDNLQPVPDIAERWHISSDGRTYTFYLRHGVSFHNGREVGAADFKYSWERACLPATGSVMAATYLGDIVGASEVLQGKATEISGVRVIDDYTLEVTIDAPKVYFLSKLACPTLFVVDRANVASGGDWWQQPNGTGPFKLKGWEKGNLLVLERNERYYGKLAKVDTVAYKLWGGVPMNMYETGDIDVAGVSVSYIDKVTDPAWPFYRQMRSVPELSFSYIGFNCSRPPFDDVNLRRAFALAVNKEKIVSVLFRGMLRQADGILPPGLPGYNEGLSGLGYDVARARELIAASRYGSAGRLPPVTITTAGWGGVIPASLEAIIQEWRDNLGVDVRVRQLEPQRYMYHLGEEKDEMFDMGWIADYPHPQDFLDVLFHTGAENNYGEYSNPRVDALLDMAAATTDASQSLKMYQQAEQQLVADAACIPL